jgi:hypothetical protein
MKTPLDTGHLSGKADCTAPDSPANTSNPS